MIPKSRIAMDSAIFQTTEDGSAIIKYDPIIKTKGLKKRTLWILLIGLIPLLLCILACGFYLASDPLFMEGLQDTKIDIGDLGRIAIVFVLLFGPLIYALKQRPKHDLIRFDTSTSMLVVGHGPSAVKIPFSRLSRVYWGSKTVFRDRETGKGVTVISIKAVLDDGETIELGSTSGKRASAVDRANEIIEFIREASDLEAHERSSAEEV